MSSSPLALLWLADHPTHRAASLRFDVASVLTSPGVEAPAIEVIEHAF